MGRIREYTVQADDGIRVRHDAKARVTVRAGRRILEDSLTPVDLIGASITLAGFTYNRLTMSGGVDWWDPSTGKSIPRPNVEIRFHPGDVLTGRKECGCSRCEGLDDGC